MTASAEDPEIERIAQKIESVSEAKLSVFRLRDEDGRTMDCLDLFQPAGEGYKGVYGVHHTRIDGVFLVHLAHSMDLKKWTHVKTLDDHASQATIRETFQGGYLLAYEKDAPNSCWIRVRYYKNLDQLKAGIFDQEFDLPRSLAPTAEGTPSFEVVKMDGDDLAKSEIELRFHYFKNARVDELARGTMKGFQSWRAKPMDEINAAFRELGARGNLGDRDRFTWRQKAYILQEVQGKNRDWSTWRVYLCDREGMPLRKLNIRTPQMAAAFTNPSVTRYTDAGGFSKYAVSLFLPSEGSDRSESGQLLYVIDPEA